MIPLFLSYSSGEQILTTELTLIALSFLSFLFEFLLLRLVLKYNSSKAFLISAFANFILVVVSLTAYLFWDWGLHVSVFGPDNKWEGLEWLLSLIAICVTSIIAELYLTKKLVKNYIKDTTLVLVSGNIFMYLILSFVYYPEPYVNPFISAVERLQFVADKTKLNLFDSSIVEIDTACCARKIYENSIYSDVMNYNIFRMPFLHPHSDDLMFSFKFLDTSLTDLSGISAKQNCCTFGLSRIEDEFDVLLEQKNPDTLYGWRRPIITDTIHFKKVRTTIIKPGHFPDTDCDCIQH